MFGSDFLFSGQAGAFYPKTIDQSLRFNDNDSAYLNRTQASGTYEKWTQSFWVKRGNIGVSQILRAAYVDSNNRGSIYFNSDDTLVILRVSGGTATNFRVTSQVFRDPSAWYHIVVSFDSNNATPNDRVKLYVNGEQVTSFSTINNPSTSNGMLINFSGATQYLGWWGGSGFYLDAYLAEVHFCDGTAYTADDFGELKSGVWVAKAPSVDYGTNGFYLDFANSADIGNDVSGEGNDWTPNNFTASDVVLDSPTDNFATWNPLDKSSNFTLSDGNLKAESGGSSDAVFATMALSSGKWYWEVECINDLSAGQIGIANLSAITSSNGIGSNEVTINGSSSTNLYNRGSSSSISATGTAANDVIGVALNLDDDQITFYRNGSIIGSANSFTNNGETWRPMIGDSGGVNDFDSIVNFGQQDFTYTPPTGFNALSTANLPDPVIDPAQDESPEDYFNTVLWTGDSSVSRSITGVGHQPDMLWIKNRSSSSYNHHLVDAVRGVSNRLVPNGTQAEAPSYVNSFESDGFELNSDTTVNGSGNSYVGWNWKANGSGVTNTDGSITSTVSANTTSGFSIVSYTGTGANATVGHGLDSAPDFTLIKNRDGGDAWIAFHSSRSGERGLLTTAAFSATTTYYTSDPTDTVLNLASIGNVNGSGDEMIAYCFHSVEGFSKFGSYTGNGSADGSFVYTGFRPAFVMVKRTDSTGDWFLRDATRDSYNVGINYLKANTADADATVGGELDYLSNGFKWRASSPAINASGGSFIYLAFAEQPFKFSLAR